MHNKAQGSINFKGRSEVSIQLSTEDFYGDFPSRAVAADVHGILMRAASLEDTLEGKIKASGLSRSEGKANGSKTLPISPVWWRPIRSLADMLCDDLKKQIQPSDKG